MQRKPPKQQQTQLKDAPYPNPSIRCTTVKAQLAQDPAPSVFLLPSLSHAETIGMCQLYGRPTLLLLPVRSGAHT